MESSEIITEQPNSVEISINAKGQYSGILSDSYPKPTVYIFKPKTIKTRCLSLKKDDKL